ncbi:MAG: BglI family type II restriction endonuclease [Patescibacteria group bacterium]
MIKTHLKNQFKKYNETRDYLLENPDILIRLEKYCSDKVFEILHTHEAIIIRDYNEASFLYPFWKNYPPDERGRQPRGDQFPWIEVGEHTIGVKVAREIVNLFQEVRDTGLPTGPDQRFIIADPEIKKITKGLTSHAWLMIDIKSVGPRDDFSHTVMSHNQVSGDGIWRKEEAGIKNRVLKATGARSKHNFYPTLSPLYVLSDGAIAPTVLLAIKPIYKMLALDGNGKVGQPLVRIELISIPNGLLLLKKPNYLKKYPGLFYPGKDDKEKNPLKVRARISFSILKSIAEWRVRILEVK